MEQKAITLKNGQVKGIYEYFVQQLQKDGVNATYSYMIYKNAELLSAVYANVMNNIYFEEKDAEFQKFKANLSELVLKYADRTEQGDIVTDQRGNAVVNEQAAEFNTEHQKLIEQYKDVLTAHDQKIKDSMAFLDSASEYMLIKIPLDSFPPTTLPAVVGLFADT